MIPTVGVLDFGLGNITSIVNAIDDVGANSLRITTPGLASDCSHLILPGVGAFLPGMQRLRSSGLIDSVFSHVNDYARPILGICLGLQMLTSISYEFGNHAGLDLIRGEVEQLPTFETNVSLPHIGWSEVFFSENMRLFAGLAQGTDFYFLHSYHVRVKQHCVTATARHGVDFVAAIELNNIYGTQFHPEKSQTNGLRLLKNFVHTA